MQKACTKDENNTNETIKVFSKMHVRGQTRNTENKPKFGSFSVAILSASL